MRTPMSAFPPPRCNTCKTPESSIGPRNLVLFIDGTSNKPGNENTNVWKLFNQVKVNSSADGSEPEQLRHYLKGIGASEGNLSLPSRLGKGIYSQFEMAFAWNVQKNVKLAYSWLVKNYRDGDHIYLFGFSRGAYQVRSLASMIHEVGLVRDENSIGKAHSLYLSIDPYNDETRKDAVMFKKTSCWEYIRIHFVGVWDTVSSLGLIKKDVHITASASVTNACHFRHALALDERRVKFMPEYFTEVNAYRNSRIRNPGRYHGDVKEVWFAGSHSDVGGTNRLSCKKTPPSGECNLMFDATHAGNVPLLWMKREAAAQGLSFEAEEFAWDSRDVDFGRKDTMTFGWNILEVLPIRHQVSFCGKGKHSQKWHLARPRSIIPHHQVHSSILSGNAYTPRATLENGIDIPIVPRRASGELWTSELQDEGATTDILSSLLRDPRTTLEALEKVLLLLDFRLNHQHTQTIRIPWATTIGTKSGLDTFALLVIHDALSGFSVSEDLVRDAKEALFTILSSPNHPGLVRTFHVLRFSAKHPEIRRRFIADKKIIESLFLALQRIANAKDNSFEMVTDSLQYLIDDGELVGEELERLSIPLEVKEPARLAVSLKMVTRLARRWPDLCKGVEPRIRVLATNNRCPVGPAAVEALVALNASLSGAIPFANILGYLQNSLPRLDAEGSSSSHDGNLTLPPVLQLSDSRELDKCRMRNLLSAIESRDARERSMATLTVLKLCGNRMIQEFFSENNVLLHIFTRQLEHAESSLLAAYSLKMCVDYGMGNDLDCPRAAHFIVAMLSKGWFDGAIGRVEGFDIFRGLMILGGLRERVISLDIVKTLAEKVEGGKHHDVRMGLMCLEILGDSTPTELTSYVEEGIKKLKSKDTRIQKRGVKILSALAQTGVGEQAIKSYLGDIVKLMLPPSGLPRSQWFGPAAALYSISKNETLRKIIRDSREFKSLVEREKNSNDTQAH